jgi:signal transduction histidine kinase
MPEHSDTAPGRRLRWVAIAFVFAWAVAVAVVTAVATGRWGDLGMPTDSEGRPRGLLVIGAATLLAGVVTAGAYRRIRGPVSDMLRAVGQVGSGDYRSVDVEVRGPRELRQLATTFNEMASRLAANEEQRRHFLADITHELRNPLAVLQSAIEAQLDGVQSTRATTTTPRGPAQSAGSPVDDGRAWRRSATTTATSGVTSTAPTTPAAAPPINTTIIATSGEMSIALLTINGWITRFSSCM